MFFRLSNTLKMTIKLSKKFKICFKAFSVTGINVSPDELHSCQWLNKKRPRDC